MTDTAEPAGGDRWATRVMPALLVALSTGYALQLFSPLRLNGDAVEYLWAAAAIADGRHYEPLGGYVAPFPFGYPAVIAVLDRLGLRGSCFIVGLNCLALAVGLYFAYRVLRRDLGQSVNVAAGLCALTMLSWTFVKHVTLPMSDMVFFGTSMACLGALSAAGASRGRGRAALLVVAAVAAVASLKLRLIGLALIPAWIVAAATGSLRPLAGAMWSHRARRVALLTASGFAMIAGAMAFLRTEYGRRLLQVLAQTDPWHALVDSLGYRLTELGELAVNTPLAKLALPGALFSTAGAAVFGAAVRGMWLRRRQWGPVEVYLGFYALVLSVWPFPEARLWLPVVPLLMGYVATAVAALPGRLRPALAVYLSIFCILGVAALGYSTRLSLSGDRFGDLYAGGSLRRIYRAGRHPPAPGASDFDLKGIAVLRRFQEAPASR